MRVLIVSQYFWPESFRINEVASTLRDSGCEVLILTGQPNYPDGVIFDGYSACSLSTDFHDQLEILRVPLFPRGRSSAVRLVCNYLSFVFSATLFGAWSLRGRSIDRILVYAPSPILQAIPAIWLGRLKSAPVITWVQDLWPESLSATGYVKNRFSLACVGRVVRWIYRRCDLLLAQSEAFVEAVRKMADGTPVVFHPHPGELAFEANTNQSPPFRFENGFNVVFAGNFGTVQALETVLEAALLLRSDNDVRFVLVGSGSRSEWLREEVARLGLTNVLLPGRFPAEAMPAIFERASVLLMSLNRNPIFSQTVPGKMQAYLAAGKPIIASIDGEAARVLAEAGAGLACPAEDSAALADAIRQLRQMPSERLEQMGQSARNYYQANFEPRMLAKRLMQVLTDTKRRQR